MIDISIVIASYNSRDDLVECLKSIRSQAGDKKLQVVVVDNASNDGSCEAVARDFKWARLIRNGHNAGFAAANNMGIKIASGKYVCLVNSDVVILHSCLDRLYSFMEKNPLAGLCAPKILNTDRTIQRSCKRFPTLSGAMLSALGFTDTDDMTRLANGRVMEAEALSGCFIMARKKAVDEVGLLDERFFFYAEDKDWCKRFSTAKWRAYYVPNAVAVHHGGRSTVKTPIRFYIELWRANLEYWDKHGGRGARIAYRLIALLHQTLRVVRSSVRYAIRQSDKDFWGYRLRRSVACLSWLVTGRAQA